MQQTVTVTDIEHSPSLSALPLLLSSLTRHKLFGYGADIGGRGQRVCHKYHCRINTVIGMLYMFQAAAAANRPMCLAAIRMQSILHQLSSHLMTREN